MISAVIDRYREELRPEHDRELSWNQSFLYFSNLPPSPDFAVRDQAALRLGFFLASWGMYRGSAFLLNFTYTAHIACVDLLLSPRFRVLRAPIFDTSMGAKLAPLILEMAMGIREAYRPFAPDSESRQASDVLVTKIILGTWCCLPALDQFLVRGMGQAGYKYSYLNEKVILEILAFCNANADELATVQAQMSQKVGFQYPLMKIVDMYFWQKGYELLAK